MSLKLVWICGNPRCFEEISFGKYCPPCKKLAIRQLIPNTIICIKCGKEVIISKHSPNTKNTKRRYCKDCYIESVRITSRLRYRNRIQ